MGIANVLLKHDFEPETQGKAEVLLAQRDSQNTTQAEVHITIGGLWIHRARIPQAIQSYRYAIAIDPDHGLALNNLACLIAESNGETEESMALIDRALKAESSNPEFLDSKGLILMQQGKPSEAAALFEAANAKGGDPRHVFHWYLALLKSGRLSDAARLRATIDVEALRAKKLSPDEVQELEKLTSASL